MSLSYNSSNFYSESIQRLSRSLARIKDANGREFNKLYSLRPQESPDGVFMLDQSSQDTIIALGIYLLESNFQHKDIVIPYLIRVLNGLIKAKWSQYYAKIFETDRIPVPERFSFCLNTLLSDIAALCEESRNVILSQQIDLLSTLLSIICSLQSNDKNEGYPNQSNIQIIMLHKVQIN